MGFAAVTASWLISSIENVRLYWGSNTDHGVWVVNMFSHVVAYGLFTAAWWLLLGNHVARRMSAAMSWAWCAFAIGCAALGVEGWTNYHLQGGVYGVFTVADVLYVVGWFVAAAGFLVLAIHVPLSSRVAPDALSDGGFDELQSEVDNDNLSTSG